MNNMRNKIFSLLVLLMTAVTGAWADDYYLVGTMNDWGPSKQFQLTQNPYNTDEYMITLTLDKDAELQVISVDGEGNWTWYPGGSDKNYVVPATGEYTVYFRPDYSGGGDWYYKCILAAAAPAPAIPVTDLDNNTWQFTMPDYAVVANIEYDTDLELREENVNTKVLADWDDYEANVTLKRTLQAGSWNTFAAPFSTAIPEGWTVKELSSATFADGTLTLNFANAASIEAGKPYLVKVAANTDLSTAPFTGAIVSKDAQPFTSTDVDFIPTLGKTLVTGPEGDKSNTDAVLFLAANNTLKNPTVVNDPEQQSSYMKGFRAYFQLKGDAVGASRFALNIDEETTAVSDLKNNEQIINNYGYDLQGRRMEGQPTKKGVYIVNGKKVVIK